MIIVEPPGQRSDPDDHVEYRPEIADRVRSRLACEDDPHCTIEVSGRRGRCGYGLVERDDPRTLEAYRWLYDEDPWWLDPPPSPEPVPTPTAQAAEAGVDATLRARPHRAAQSSQSARRPARVREPAPVGRLRAVLGRAIAGVGLVLLILNGAGVDHRTGYTEPLGLFVAVALILLGIWIERRESD